MTHKTMTGPLALLAVAAAAAPSAASGDRELAARLRAESASYASLEAVSSAAPQPLTASLLLQTRYMFTSRKNPGFFGSNRLETVGFSTPRAQVRLDANIANSQLLAHVSFDFGDAEGRRGRGDLEPGGGTAQLREAYAQYNFGGEQSGYYLKAGQFRSLLIHEESVAPEYQLAVERSVTNEFFAPGNTQGVALGFVGPSLAWEASFNKGIAFMGNREPANTGFDSQFEADAALTVRADWKLAGDWTRFQDFTSWRGDDVAARVGAGLHWQRHGDTNPGDLAPDFLNGVAKDITNITWTIDAAYESDGWHAYVAYVGHRLEWEYTDFPTDNTLIFTQHGIVAQAGMLLSDDVEVFARYDGFMLDNTLVNGFGADEDYYHFITVGVNWYLTPQSHAAKFSFDLTAALSESDVLDAGINNSILFPDPSVTGLLGNTNEEYLLRAQLQLLF